MLRRGRRPAHGRARVSVRCVGAGITRPLVGRARRSVGRGKPLRHRHPHRPSVRTGAPPPEGEARHAADTSPFRGGKGSRLSRSFAFSKLKTENSKLLAADSRPYGGHPVGRTSAHVCGRFVNRPYVGTCIRCVGAGITRPLVGRARRSVGRGKPLRHRHPHRPSVRTGAPPPEGEARHAADTSPFRGGKGSRLSRSFAFSKLKTENSKLLAADSRPYDRSRPRLPRLLKTENSKLKTNAPSLPSAPQSRGYRA